VLITRSCPSLAVLSGATATLALEVAGTTGAATFDELGAIVAEGGDGTDRLAARVTDSLVGGDVGLLLRETDAVWARNGASASFADQSIAAIPMMAAMATALRVTAGAIAVTRR
jgi:hypothetical protein